MADYETMVSELDAGDATPDPSTTDQTPVGQPETTPGFDYYVGDKANRIPEAAEFSFKHNGQLARVPATKLVNNYRQTSHLEAKLKEMNDRYSAYEKEVGPLDEWTKRRDELGKYEQLQKWSQENPDQWQRIWEGYERAQNGLPPQATGEAGPQFDHLHKVISGLKEEIGGLNTWKQEREAADLQTRTDNEVGKIEEEAINFGKTYEKYGISLDEVNEDGISLKGQIIKFAVDNKIGSFDVAASAYLRDTLIEKAAQYGRQESVKGLKGDASAGIIDRSGVPPQGQVKPVDVRGMSEDQRKDAALAEMSAETAT